MNMMRSLMSAAVVFALLALAVQAPAMESVEVDRLVKAFDPYRFTEEQSHFVTNGFTEPASDIALEVQDAAWFSLLVFLPFLIIPNILLLVVIFKFRDRKDGRKPATFVHNNAIEIAWTAIPVVALIIVSIPLTGLLWKTDLPSPEIKTGNPLSVTVYGKQFSWIFEYPDHDISVATENGAQLPIVLVKDRIASLQLTSHDVNHAWAVPSFGVKKDCFPLPRFNYTWFTPTIEGYFEGQCYELCGADHGKMVFGAVVVEQEDFDHWVDFMHNQADANEVVDALVALESAAAAESGAALDEAISEYLAKDDDQARLNSLAYWTAYRYWTTAQVMHVQGKETEGAAYWSKVGAEQRGLLDGRIQTILSKTQSPSTDESAAVASVEEEG